MLAADDVDLPTAGVLQFVIVQHRRPVAGEVDEEDTSVELIDLRFRDRMVLGRVVLRHRVGNLPMPVKKLLSLPEYDR